MRESTEDSPAHPFCTTQRRGSSSERASTSSSKCGSAPSLGRTTTSRSSSAGEAVTCSPESPTPGVPRRVEPKVLQAHAQITHTRIAMPVGVGGLVVSRFSREAKRALPERAFSPSRFGFCSALHGDERPVIDLLADLLQGSSNKLAGDVARFDVVLTQGGGDGIERVKLNLRRRIEGP